MIAIKGHNKVNTWSEVMHQRLGSLCPNQSELNKEEFTPWVSNSISFTQYKCLRQILQFFQSIMEHSYAQGALVAEEPPPVVPSGATSKNNSKTFPVQPPQ